MKSWSITFVSLALFLAGCTQTMIKTDPPNAEIYINQKYINRSPAPLPEEFKDNFIIKVTKGECFGQHEIRSGKNVVDQAVSQAKEAAEKAISRLKGESILPKEILVPLRCAVVKTDPEQAEVYLNKKPLGKGSVFLKDEIREGDVLSAALGEYRVSLAFNGEIKKNLVDQSPLPQENPLLPGETSFHREIRLSLGGQIEIGSIRTGVREEGEDLETFREILHKVKNPANNLIIYDASGSMRWPLTERDSTPRFEPGQKAITDFINKANPEDFFGLMVYGHRLRSGSAGTQQRVQSCRDIELVLPLQRIDKNKLIQTIRGIGLKDHRGDTPLQQSILMGIEVLKGRPGEKRMFIVTDGEDECGGFPDRAAKEAAKYGINVHIMAYGIGITKEGQLRDTKAAEIRDILKNSASAGKGLFFDTKGAEDLYRAMIKVELSSLTYVVKDTSGKEILEGNLGQKFLLDSGPYEIVFNADKPFNARVNVRPAQKTKILLTLSQDQRPEIQAVYE